MRLFRHLGSNPALRTIRTPAVQNNYPEILYKLVSATFAAVASIVLWLIFKSRRTKTRSPGHREKTLWLFYFYADLSTVDRFSSELGRPQAGLFGTCIR